MRTSDARESFEQNEDIEFAPGGRCAGTRQEVYVHGESFGN